MWALLVVEPYPVPQHTAGVLQGLEPVPVGTLLLDRKRAVIYILNAT